MARQDKSTALNTTLKHPAFAKFFDVDTPLSEDIGERCIFKNPTYPAQQGYFTIIAVQKNYKDELMYRVENDNDYSGWGMLAYPDDLEPTDVPPQNDVLDTTPEEILRNAVHAYDTALSSSTTNTKQGIAVYYTRYESGLVADSVFYQGAAAKALRDYLNTCDSWSGKNGSFNPVR